MKYYISYKFDFFSYFKMEIERFIADNPKDQIFLFYPDDKEKYPDWKDIAKTKIAESDCLIYLQKEDEKDADESDYYNIGFEIEQAINDNKKIIVVQMAEKNAENNRRLTAGYVQNNPKQLYRSNYLNQYEIKYCAINKLDGNLIKKKIYNIEDRMFKTVDLSNKDEIQLLLEEYKLMLDTSEKMIDRRQGTNNFYITLCATAITAMVTLLASNWNTTAMLVLTFGMSLILTFLCRNWEKSLESYRKSNESKYEVLNAIEKRLPASIFLSEWEYGKIHNYESYSQREVKVPQIFRIVFLLIAIASAVALGYYLVSYITNL